MNRTHDFLKLILDSLTESIVVINARGEILFVNRSWVQFGDGNACKVTNKWEGVNYIEECDKATEMGDEYGRIASDGIRGVINNNKSLFYLEYPCHSPTEKRWFMMRVTPFSLNNEQYYVISHQNITERKLAEEEIRNLAHIDGITNIPNRRSFDEFLFNEWRRCKRLNRTLSLAILDIDHFKLLNDTYGHQAGDECLIKVAHVLTMYANRPGDICSRYGGEEFALVWGDTPLDQAEELARGILEKIADLRIPNEKSPTANRLTVSIGIVSVVPEKESELSNIIGMADSLLYEAKESGRNRAKSQCITKPFIGHSR